MQTASNFDKRISSLFNLCSEMVHSILLRELLSVRVTSCVYCIESTDEELLTDPGNVVNLIQTLFLKAARSFMLIKLKMGVTIHFVRKVYTF